MNDPSWKLGPIYGGPFKCRECGCLFETENPQDPEAEPDFCSDECEHKYDAEFEDYFYERLVSREERDRDEDDSRAEIGRKSLND